MSTDTSTPAKPKTRTSSKPDRPPVSHYHWLSEAKAAAQLGIYEVPSICRRAWVHTDEQRIARHDAQGRVTNAARNQCRECLRILEARARRELEGR